MKVAADASVLVAESLRRRGEQLVAHRNLELVIADAVWSETIHELGRRLDEMVRHGRFSQERRDQVLRDTLALLSEHMTVVAEAEYSRHEAVARARIPRDPNDWPTVAVALALDASIWTNDYDFFGCGVPVWITETISPHLDA